jgi:hypothetical protein
MRLLPRHEPREPSTTQAAPSVEATSTSPNDGHDPCGDSQDRPPGSTGLWPSDFTYDSEGKVEEGPVVLSPGRERSKAERPAPALDARRRTARAPKRNMDYWAPKFQANIARDRRNDEALASAGWLVVRIWEHEQVMDAADRVQEAVRQRLAEA